MDITTIITYLKGFIPTLLTFFMILSPAFGGDGAVYTAKDPDALVASFAVVSDIHVETNRPESYDNYNDLLEGIKGGKNIDAAIYTGDNVMNGQDLESILFYGALRAINPAERNFVVAGNHDLGNGEGDLPKLLKNYINNNKLYLGEDVGEGYYYNVVNGCYVICLISEDPTSEDFQMSKAQYDWLEGVLKEADEAEAPIFVFNHFPLRYLDNNTEVTGEELAKLLVNYGTDLYVHGHIHDHLGADNFYTWREVDSINLPRSTELTEYEAGDGIVIEVYEDEFVVRGRDFIAGEWIDGLDYTYEF